MKKLIIIALIILTNNAIAQQMKKVELIATGLTCSMCSNAINKQLKSMPEVDKVDIDLNKNIFTVTLKSNNNLTPKSLKDRVEDAGFFVGSFIAYIYFDNVVVQDNKQINNYVFVDTKPQTLNGIVKVKLLDKGYVTSKEYKKLSKTFAKYPNYSKVNETDFHLKMM